MRVDLTPLRLAAPAVVGALGLGQLIAFGTSLYLLTVLAPEIAAETGWTQPRIVGGFTLGVLSAAAVAPVAGLWVARGQGRRTLTLSAFLFALGLGAIGLSGSYFLYVVGWSVVGLAMGCGLYDVAFGTIGLGLGAGARRTITQVALIGGFASTIFWPLTGFLLEFMSWREVCLAYAALHLCVSAPLYAAFAPRPKPSPASEKPIVATRLAPGERAQYLAMGTVVVVETAVTAAMSVFLVQFLTDRGASPGEAIALAALVGPAQVAARLMDLTIGSRVHPRISMMVGIGGVSLGIVLLRDGGPLTAAALIAYGAGMGVASIARGTLPLALFGPVRNPALMGRVGSVGLIAQAAAPTALAFVVSSGGLAAGLTVVSLIATCNFAIATALARMTGSERGS